MGLGRLMCRVKEIAVVCVDPPLFLLIGATLARIFNPHPWRLKPPKSKFQSVQKLIMKITSRRLSASLCTLGSLLLIWLSHSVAEEEKVDPFADQPGDPTPLQITRKVQSSLDKVRGACVAIRQQASGAIISRDGWVLTAGHMAARLIKNPEPFAIQLEDGRTPLAKLVGWNKSLDIALLKILDESVEWPAVEVAEAAPAPGAICFHYAHTAGYKTDRPAQLRLGRIRCAVQKDGKTTSLVSDAAVQPGDSGGPLFDINGRLIGLCTHAGPIGVNRYCPIDAYHRDKNRLEGGEVWGDPEEAVLSVAIKQSDERTRQLLFGEIQKRLKDRYPPAMDLLLNNIQGSRARLDFGQVVRHLGGDALMILESAQVEYGLDDPSLVARLPALPLGAPLPLAVVDGRGLITYGVPATDRHMVVKWSEIKGGEAFTVKTAPDTATALRFAGADKEWDLALLEIIGEETFSPMRWPDKEVPIRAGTGLMCPDTRGRLCWGVASDTRRPIKEPVSIGPMEDTSIISSYRTPYPSIIRHDLPLFAKDAGKPVYDMEGRLVGLHMGRICRTQGLIVDIEDVHKSVTAMLAEALPRNSPD